MSFNLTAIIHGTFTGHNGAGACTLIGAKVGDFVLGIYLNGSLSSTNFESVISVADQIQQNAGANESSFTFDVVLARLP